MLKMTYDLLQNFVYVVKILFFIIFTLKEEIKRRNFNRSISIMSLWIHFFTVNSIFLWRTSAFLLKIIYFLKPWFPLSGTMPFVPIFVVRIVSLWMDHGNEEDVESTHAIVALMKSCGTFYWHSFHLIPPIHAEQGYYNSLAFWEIVFLFIVAKWERWFFFLSFFFLFLFFCVEPEIQCISFAHLWWLQFS